MGLFKAYDIRGVYGEDLTDETAYRIGRAFVTKLGCKTVVVGHDMRESSGPLQEQLIRGLAEQGADVVKIGLCTTPMMYFATARHGYDAGISVTASHNPGEYNGFKMVKKDAVPLSGDTGIYGIRDLVEKNQFEPAKKGSVSEREGILGEYIANAFKHVDVSRLKQFKIVVDTGNGMAGMVIPDFLRELPCQFTHMFPELDGTFPNHEANPLKLETLKWLQDEVKKQQADIGVGFDGDADRIGFVDENGSIVPADLLIAVIAIELLKEKPGALILYDLRSSKSVKEAIEAAGGRTGMTRVGHSFIKEDMRRENALFAGELSAHYYYQKNFYIESPYIVLLLLLKMMNETGKKFSELWKPLAKYHQTGEINFEVADKEAAIRKVKNAFSDAKNMFELDGLSVEYDDWWLNVRPSNTESLLRLNLEARTVEKMNKMKDKVIGILSE